EALRANGWPSLVDSVRQDLDHPSGAPVEQTPTPGEPLPLDELLNDLLTALDTASVVAPAIGAEGSGTNSDGKLTLQVSPAGLLSCGVDQAWASRQNAAAMMRAFDEALVRAKADLAARMAEPGPAGNLDRVLDGALTVLDDPEQLGGAR